MKPNYEATIQKDDGIFSTLVVKYNCENTSIMWSTNLTIYEISRQFNIDPSNISSINVEKEGTKRTIVIKYTKFDLSDITSLSDKSEQIKSILNLLGYSSDKVESITSNNSSWFANVYEHYDPDEFLAKLDHEISISRKISKVLGFYVHVSIV
jgi:hypothetical protein